MSNCPHCDSVDTVVKDSRPHIKMDIKSVRRRRMCLSCSFRFTTYEVTQEKLNELDAIGDTPSLLNKAKKVRKVLLHLESILTQ